MFLGIYFFRRFSLAVSLLLFVFSCLYIRERNNSLRQCSLIRWLAPFLGMSILSMAWASNMSIALQSNISLLQRGIFAVITYYLITTEKRIEDVWNCLLLGGIGVIVCVLAFYGVEGLRRFFLGLSESRLGGEIINVNVIGFALQVTGILAWYRYRCGKSPWAYLLLLLICFVLIIATGGRSSLIGLILAMILLKRQGTNRMGLFFPVFLVLFVFIIVYYWTPKSLRRFEDATQMIAGEVEVRGSVRSRLDYVRFGVRKIIKNPLFGFGAGQFRYHWFLENGYYISSHNNYIEVLFSYGILGFFLWYGMLLDALFGLRKRKTNSTQLLFTLLCVRLISDFSGHSIGSIFPYLLLGISFSMIDRQSETESKIVNALDSDSLPDNGAHSSNL